MQKEENSIELSQRLASTEIELPTFYQQFIHKSRYARWRDELGRRETWDETVGRYMKFMDEHLAINHNYLIPADLYAELANAILTLEVMPSMRAMMTSGPALERCNVAGYNCSYVPIDHPRAFDEILYVLMCGTGVGFSVEKHNTDELPVVNEHFERSNTAIVVEDSKAGWARAFRELVAMLYSGQVPTWDTSRLRPAGARLKTFGGRSSGPEPLRSLFEFTTATFKQAAGRKLTPLECHDIICKVGEVVVVGGVRRSALISLSDLGDAQMRDAKSGRWWETQTQRTLANNSAVYDGKPDITIFMDEWTSLAKSGSGERGLFNREASCSQLPDRRDPDYIWGTNPCSEIILRPYQFCNLSEVVVRPADTLDDLKRKVRLATILGTFQSTLTDFKYLRKVWKKNTEEERLLGVSLTGITDNSSLSDTNKLLWLTEMKAIAIETNKQLSEQIGIPQSTAITCVKPSGTVSQLVDAASGIHTRYAKHYIRTVRQDIKDPLTKFLIESGVPHEVDLHNPQNIVFSFPMKSPDSAMLRDDINAIGQLELWKHIQTNWCEHKPSATIYVKNNEWLQVGAWVYENFNAISGVSFLPHTEHVYQQAPYQEITEDEYHAWLTKMPKDITWEDLALYEKDDYTTSSQEYACVAGLCEI